MTDDPRFDAIDDELSRRFRSGSHAESDPDAVLDGMRPRLQRARTRRRASIASGVAGLAAVVVAVVLVVGGTGGNGNSVRVPPASGGPQRTVPSVPTTALAGGSATPDTVPGTADDRGADNGTAAITPTAPGATTPTQAPAPPAGSAPTENAYTSPGGSIVVRFADNQVSLASNSPAAGYTAEIHDNGPTRVEVRFNNGQTEWRIRVDVVNGQLAPAEITQH